MIKKFLAGLLRKMKCKLEESMPSEDYISYRGHVRGEPSPKVVCTCGWEFGPKPLIIMVFEAKEHSRRTGHRLIDSQYC